MKPPPFVYVAPTSLDEAVGALAEHGEDAKVLAGGQSLIPLLSLRLARPTALVDLNGVAELSSIAVNGMTAIGAMTRHRAVERSADVATQVPLLAAAIPYIGHVAIRTRGTIGGSLAHADPAAELPAVALALDATFEATSTRGTRTISAADFFVGYFTTALEPDEILTKVTFPNAAPGTGVSVQEMARRHGDFAMVGCRGIGRRRAATCASRSSTCPTGRSERSRPRPRCRQGAPIDEVAALAARDLDPTADLHASAAYRRSVAQVLVRRALTEAAARAKDAS